MMYQCLSDIPSPADAEHERHDETHDLIRNQEKDCSNRDHHEYHGGCDRGLAPGRPSDLLGLGAHFLHELERTDHRLPAAPGAARPASIFSGFEETDYAWQEWRDSNPQPPVLETGALAN